MLHSKKYLLMSNTLSAIRQPTFRHNYKIPVIYKQFCINQNYTPLDYLHIHKIMWTNHTVFHTAFRKRQW